MTGILSRWMAFPYSGVLVVAGFTLWVLLAELGPSWLGGNEGAFLYVTLHFIVNPLLGVVLGCAVALHGLMQKKLRSKILGAVVSILPFWIFYVGITGSTWLTEALGVQFRR